MTMDQSVIRSPLGPSWTPGHYGTVATGDDGSAEAGIRALHTPGLLLVEIAALPGKGEAMRAAVKKGLKLDLGDGSPAASLPNAVCSGPDRCLLTGFDLAAVKAAVGDLGLAVDQSSGRVRLSIGGADVPGLLAKSCPLDLAKWPVGMSQASHFLHIGCTWYRRSETGFDLYIGRSFARSAAEWLIESAAEFGVEILVPDA